MPAHNLIQLVSAVVKGHCDIHGTDSRECGAMREAGTILVGGLALVGIASALSKR
ncbi:MAG: hypothetical protein IH841_08885 [Thaumarchaeota archaeon]|nr:hypothetical protein [Nitrososphaerota archaeon]